ncbi:MAG: hypothetical protein H6745_02540 [Deltaproteobacteria bacterium]|nr:hypothetical protein [Deltaproteobacteria bacterium]
MSSGGSSSTMMEGPVPPAAPVPVPATRRGEVPGRRGTGRDAGRRVVGVGGSGSKPSASSRVGASRAAASRSAAATASGIAGTSVVASS